MKRTALVSTLFIAALPTFSFAETTASGPSYCQTYEPELISMSGTNGAYMRISPDGNYAIVSDGNSSILDLRGTDHDGHRAARVIHTYMNAEAYPVEGNWNYITSPGTAMYFYRFKDLLEKAEDARPAEIVDRRPNSDSQASNPEHPEIFVDREHYVQYYHSAAELPGGDSSHATYRVSLFEQDTFRDYDVWFNPDGSAAKVEKKQIKPLCQNLTASQQANSDRHISQPILSKDGTEMAGQWKGTTHIFKVNDDGTCEVEDDLGAASYKVSFSYPEPGKRAKIVFTNGYITTSALISNGPLSPSQVFNHFGTFIYDPNTKKMTPLAGIWGGGTPNYPGWTKDGRILAQVRNSQNRYAIAVIDPKRLAPLPDPSKVPDNALAKHCFQDAETYAQALISLGEVWNSICRRYPQGNPGGMIPPYQQMQALSLDPETCVKMVHENYRTWKTQHPTSSLTESHLKAVCKTSH